MRKPTSWAKTIALHHRRHFRYRWRSSRNSCLWRRARHRSSGAMRAEVIIVRGFSEEEGGWRESTRDRRNAEKAARAIVCISAPHRRPTCLFARPVICCRPLARRDARKETLLAHDHHVSGELLSLVGMGKAGKHAARARTGKASSSGSLSWPHRCTAPHRTACRRRRFYSFSR